MKSEYSHCEFFEGLKIDEGFSLEKGESNMADVPITKIGGITARVNETGDLYRYVFNSQELRRMNTEAEACYGTPDMGVGYEHQEMVATLKKCGNLIHGQQTGYDCDLVHMAFGLMGEAGEICACILKFTFEAEDLDFENLLEEFGDASFFMEGIRQRTHIMYAFNKPQLPVHYDHDDYMMYNFLALKLCALASDIGDWCKRESIYKKKVMDKALLVKAMQQFDGYMLKLIHVAGFSQDQVMEANI